MSVVLFNGGNKNTYQPILLSGGPVRETETSYETSLDAFAKTIADLRSGMVFGVWDTPRLITKSNIGLASEYVQEAIFQDVIRQVYNSEFIDFDTHGDRMIRSFIHNRPSLIGRFRLEDCATTNRKIQSAARVLLPAYNRIYGNPSGDISSQVVHDDPPGSVQDISAMRDPSQLEIPSWVISALVIIALDNLRKIMVQVHQVEPSEAYQVTQSTLRSILIEMNAGKQDGPKARNIVMVADALGVADAQFIFDAILIGDFELVCETLAQLNEMSRKEAANLLHVQDVTIWELLLSKYIKDRQVIQFLFESWRQNNTARIMSQYESREDYMFDAIDRVNSIACSFGDDISEEVLRMIMSNSSNQVVRYDFSIEREHSDLSYAEIS